MSLVGSLEDLGLGEILQIVSLSGKSGVLWIRSPFGEGRILFDRGAIRGARIEGGAHDLRSLLAESGALPEADLEWLLDEARATGAALAEVVVARTALDAARLDELLERHVESVVLRMFSWTLGEFSFEVRDESSAGDELLLRAGMNAQFLALEGARLRDESTQLAQPPAAPESAAADGDVLDPSAEAAELEITVLELLDEGDTDGLPLLEIDPDEPVLDEDPTLTGDAQQARIAEELLLPPPPPAPALRPTCRAAVLVDRDLEVLEWAKQAIAPLGLRTHIFPRSELAIQRIRQYFVRGEVPLVVLSSETPADPVSGARDWSEIAARLRAQVPHLPLVLIANAGENIVPTSERGVPDALATRPAPSVLADERAREAREELATELRQAVATATRRSGPARAPAQPAARDAAEPLRALREWSARLRDPASPSEVLRLVLEFAGHQLERVVAFWVRDGEAQAMAQHGLGADDAALAAFCVATDEVALFRKVLESRAPIHAAPAGPSDGALLARLGAPAPSICFVAPIESGDQVAALLYGDNAPSRRPIGDTSALEVIVHEAGLALDRAVLERALEQVEGQRRHGDPA